MIVQLALVAVLVLVNAAFAGTEMALVTLREGQLKRLETQSRSGEILARLARLPNQFLATIQIGITVAGFLAAAAAAVSLAEPLEAPLSSLGNAAGPVSVIIVTVLLSYITLVLGEIAPKRIAMQNAERWGLVMARPLALLTRLTHPAVWLLSRSTDVVVRVLGGDPDQQRDDVTEDELRDMVSSHETFTDEQRLIIDGAFEIASRTLDQVLVPRSKVFVLDSTWSCAEALPLLTESGHTRAPIAPGRMLDEVVGTVHMRQLLGTDGDLVGAIAVEIPVFPESASVLATIRELQAERAQMALVINEHGGAEGIVTMEDLIEELVGEIYDETDPDLIGVRHEDDGTIVVPGDFPIHDLRDIGVQLPEGDYATVAGLVLADLGHLPSIGQHLEIGEWRIHVRNANTRSITEIALQRLPEPNAPD